jgi:ubiquinol-cytochrome c reductase iron-sulfur subunit
VHHDRPEAGVTGPRSSRRAELAVAALLGLAAVCAAGFVAVYALDSIGHQTQLLGLTLGAAFAFVAAAFIAGRRLVAGEDAEDEYGGPAPEAADEIGTLVEESATGIERRRLLAGAGAAAGAAIGAALLAPVLSLGPVFDLASMARTPWRRGRRLVDETGAPVAASAVRADEFLTAYPEGANPEEIGSPIILIRLDPATLRLPASRRSWAPQGILAYSKICTHAGCAIALYRAPLFQPVEQPPGLVCPCHYSTFDPATGGTVVFGPAGRALPQLPLRIDRAGNLRAGGTFSGPVGPSWWGVRRGRATS